METDAKLLGRRLLAWFKRARRPLPWREMRRNPDPYRVWLSEIMLQQTTVATVAPYYERFLAKFPTIESLARAPLDDVLHAWQGLGLYARARNLHRAARMVAGTLGGRFPDDEAGLALLPGVGPYTAAAIAAIAFGRKAVPVDGNVARVIARLYGLRTRLPEGRAALFARARAMLPARPERGASFNARGDSPAHHPGDFAEALMDLGATVCTPRKPRCGECPWRSACRAFALGNPEAYPPKKQKTPRPVRHAVVFWAEFRGRVLVRRRPEKGLLGGMMEFPSTPWRAKPWTEAEALRHAPAKGAWRILLPSFRHVFSHFALEARVARARVGGAGIKGLRWWPVAGLGRLALPSAMRKAAKIAGFTATGRTRPANRTGSKAWRGR
jgi:A/G-specific adenine glycosylase